MAGQSRFFLIFSLAFILFGLIGEVTAAPSQEPSTPTIQVSTKPDNQQIIADIKNGQQVLKKQATAIAGRLSLATSQEQVEEARLLELEQEIFNQTDTAYDQQLVKLEQLQLLDVRNQQLKEDIANLKIPPLADQHFSFMELDQNYEELNQELRTEEGFESKISVVDGIVQQAVTVLEQKQDKLKRLEENTAPEADSLSLPAELNLEIARRDVELAEQLKALHQFELSVQKQVKTVLQTHVELLKLQVEFLQTHAVFSQDELQDQLQRINKDDFVLNRDLVRIKEQQLTVKNSLDQSRKKLNSADPDDQKRIEVYTEALRLKLKALETKVDTATRRVELLASWKEVWQQRYDIFNQLVDQATLSKWRNKATQQLKQIDNEKAALNLWLADWRSRQITLSNKMDNEQKVAPDERHGLTQQREHINSILEHFQDLHTELENSRRLQTKLIDEISTRTSQRSWNDWFKLAVDYKINANSMLDWSYALVSALATFALLFFLRWILIKRLKYLGESSDASLINGFLASIKHANIFFFLMLAVYVASQFLTFSLETTTNIAKLTKVAFVFQATVWASSFVRSWVFRVLSRRTKRDGASMGALTIFNFTSQVILWSIALLLIMQNLGIDVTALVAGLGIGGVAVALSMQQILKDVFSSLSIVLDKPFVIGDFIIFDDFMGSIEHIGIKTTRIRSLTGEQIICANGDLLNTRIRNYKRMQERRVIFNIGVVYQTSAEKLPEISVMFREIIEAQENIRFDRAHFLSYTDFALLFEIVYYVLSPDYNIYMDIQQAINLEIFKRFQAAGIEFAHPTQSLYIKNIANADQALPTNLPWGMGHDQAT
ncbi:mechanosensitive ion channel domain-containing protein [Methylobacter sp. S3L5C]|uniref:mechanosensitive ion channel domain-containing protein n=1 Tax=Methylobacter sp. S3L5C TaxID=2839024 RepID=UPI001FADCD63|nr:mechanosensitive ion channel domain-containing protein [Methylobacter sp. S3L5C]UOA08540.1 mechanosensitive ion channel [Methylobacter sp. S3L5C]